MRQVVVMTPPDARFGFALTGVRQRALLPEQFPPELKALLEDRGVGLVVVDERLASGAMQANLREMERRWPGLVVMLPAPREGARVEEDYVLRLIRRALGYQVRLGA